jgi:hypothetical protein
VITDVRGNWAEPWIMLVARAAIVEPFANHTFQPGAVVQRIDLAQAVSRLLARLAAADALQAWQADRVRFTDLAASHLAYPAASLAAASGVVPAGPDGSFQPSRAVSGAEAVQAVERLRSMAPAADPFATLR